MSKIATDLEQSKKLAEFLPLESADMYWNNSSIRGVDYVDAFHLETAPYKDVVDASWVKSHKSINPMFEVVPAWSLSALLTILHFPSLHKTVRGWRCDTYKNDNKHIMYGESKNNPVDACYEMIIKLKERNML